MRCPRCKSEAVAVDIVSREEPELIYEKIISNWGKLGESTEDEKYVRFFCLECRFFYLKTKDKQFIMKDAQLEETDLVLFPSYWV